MPPSKAQEKAAQRSLCASLPQLGHRLALFRATKQARARPSIPRSWSSPVYGYQSFSQKAFRGI